MLEFENVSFSYGQPILQNINLRVRPGEITCLLGESGIGKTTILQLAAGLLQPTAGVIRCDAMRPGPQIGYLQQQNSLLPWRRVWENVALGQQLSGQPVDHAAIALVLGKVGLTDEAEALPSALSGGQKQRVALARQLLMGTSVLLLDEPLAALDIVLRQELAELIKHAVRAHGIMALVVTHYPDEAIFLGDKICLLSGRPADVSHQWTSNGTTRSNTAFHEIVTAMRERSPQ